MDYKDVHTEHCCIRHGCKYGDTDCTVFSKELKQSYLCEFCEEDEWKKKIEELTFNA